MPSIIRLGVDCRFISLPKKPDRAWRILSAVGEELPIHGTWLPASKGDRGTFYYSGPDALTLSEDKPTLRFEYDTR